MNKEVHEVRDDTIPEGARKPLPKWIVASIVSAAVLAGLGALYILTWPFMQLVNATPSTEDRYYYINNTLQSLDYESSGAVVEESYDGKRGPLSEARFVATIEGSDAYDILSEKIVEVGEGECSVNEDNTQCFMARPSISLYDEGNNRVSLILTDSGAGK